MKVAVAILLLLIAACVAGSVIPQGEAASYYRETWPGLPGEWILACKLDDVFHSVWFAALSAFLCLNLLGCNLIHVPALIRTWKSFRAEEGISRLKKGEAFWVPEDPVTFLGKMGFRSCEKREADGVRQWYAVRGKAGLFGPWLTHLGLLIVIAGFSLGQIFTQSSTVYGVPGQTKPIADTGYSLTIDSFDIRMLDEETVDQYVAELTVTNDKTGASRSGQASVNHPLSLFGMKMYQNSTGFAATVSILRSGELRQQEVLCVGETIEVADEPGLVVYLRNLYPDYVMSSSGMPATASSVIRNPAYLYILYYNEQILGMNVLLEGQEITIDEYTVRFSEPQNYTLIQVKRDPYAWLALIGGLILMAALLLTFYFQTAEVFAQELPEGGYRISGYSRKGGVLFAEDLKSKVLAAGGKTEVNRYS